MLYEKKIKQIKCNIARTDDIVVINIKKKCQHVICFCISFSVYFSRNKVAENIFNFHPAFFCDFMDDPNSFAFGNNSAMAAMTNALQAAASVGMIDGKNPQGMPFYPYPTFHTGSTMSSSLRPMHSALQNRTPFGINDILSRSLSSSNSPSDSNGSPLMSIASNIDAGSRFSSTMAPDSAVAQAAAMYFGASGMGNCLPGNASARFGKPLAELPGRAPIYWPGIISDDWREKLTMQGT